MSLGRRFDDIMIKVTTSKNQLMICFDYHYNYATGTYMYITFSSGHTLKLFKVCLIG